MSRELLAQSALMVIDMQRGFMKRGAEKAIEPVRSLTQQWPAEKIFFLKYKNYPGSSYTRYLDWHDFMTSEDIALVEGIMPQGARSFDHYGYAPPPELLDMFKKEGIKNVAVCGVDTDACVMAATFALWDVEIRPLVLAAYCASSGGDSFHRAALDLMMHQFGSGSIIRETVV